jgi:hypothetical protein
MPRYFVRETFFRPREHARESSALPAIVFNNLRLALNKSGGESLFIPIRSMQFQAIVERDEIIFVDNHGGYAHQDGEGGRLICLAWQPAPARERESLDDPVLCEIVYYFPKLKDVHRRLISEFPPVLEKILQRRREQDVRATTPRVLPLRRDGCRSHPGF